MTARPIRRAARAHSEPTAPIVEVVAPQEALDRAVRPAPIRACTRTTATATTRVFVIQTPIAPIVEARPERLHNGATPVFITTTACAKTVRKTLRNRDVEPEPTVRIATTPQAEARQAGRALRRITTTPIAIADAESGTPPAINRALPCWVAAPTPVMGFVFNPAFVS